MNLKKMFFWKFCKKQAEPVYVPGVKPVNRAELIRIFRKYKYSIQKRFNEAQTRQTAGRYNDCDLVLINEFENMLKRNDVSGGLLEHWVGRVFSLKFDYNYASKPPLVEFANWFRGLYDPADPIVTGEYKNSSLDSF